MKLYEIRPTVLTLFGLIITGLSVVALSGCGKCGWGTYYLRGLAGYSGDGVISDTSQPSGLFGTRGYVIDFPKFDLGQKYNATFHLSGLPTLGRARAEISFMIEEKEKPTVSAGDRLKGMVNATLKYVLTDSSGRVITKLERPLKSLTWSSPIHGRSGYALYETGNSFFKPNSHENYTLAIEYSGDPQLISKTGRLYIWCGCGGS